VESAYLTAHLRCTGNEVLAGQSNSIRPDQSRGWAPRTKSHVPYLATVPKTLEPCSDHEHHQPRDDAVEIKTGSIEGVDGSRVDQSELR
jgi:hypothetical protein